MLSTLGSSCPAAGRKHTPQVYYFQWSAGSQSLLPCLSTPLSAHTTHVHHTCMPPAHRRVETEDVMFLICWTAVTPAAVAATDAVISLACRVTSAVLLLQLLTCLSSSLLHTASIFPQSLVQHRFCSVSEHFFGPVSVHV